MVPKGRIQKNSPPARKEEDRQLGARNHTWQRGDAERSTEVLCKGKVPDCLSGE